MTYLLRDRLGTYYFRRVIPPELRPFMPSPWTGKANWKASLRTKDPKAAKSAASRYLSRCTSDFGAAERAKRGEVAFPSKPTLAEHLSPQEVEGDFMADLLGSDNYARSDGDARKQHQTPQQRAQWPDLTPMDLRRRGMEEDFHLGYGQGLELLANDYRSALARSDPRAVDAELRQYLRQRGIPIDPTSDAYYQLGLVVLRAHVEAFDKMLARQRGEVVRTPKAPGSDRGPRLSEAFEAWKARSGARGSRHVGSRTLQEAEHAVRRLTEWCGDIRLGELSRQTVREFRDALAQVPKGLPAKLRQLSLRELLKRDLGNFAPLHAATVNKTLGILRAIVAQAEETGKLDAVPGFRNPIGKGLKLEMDDTAEDSRRSFTKAELDALFATAVFQAQERPRGGAGEAAFWLPLIGLLSGARLGELAQLRVSDLAEDPETGIWFFDIGTAGGRRVKTASSRRRVPVHPALRNIGLLNYRTSLRTAEARPEAALWPDLQAKPGEGQPAAAWSKYFNRSLRLKAGLSDPALVFHSFKRAARDAGLHKEVHDVLTGHAGGGDVGVGYGRGIGLQALADAMARIAAPRVVQELRWVR